MHNLDIWVKLMIMDPSQGSFDMPLVQISDDKVFVEDNNGIDKVFVEDNNKIFRNVARQSCEIEMTNWCLLLRTT
jgi:hypothetical protein